MRKAWHQIDWENCPECGAAIEVFTEVPNSAVDGDCARCVDGCESLSMWMSVDDDNGEAWLQWCESERRK